MLELFKEFWPLLLWLVFMWAGRRKKKRPPAKTPAPAQQRQPQPTRPQPTQPRPQTMQPRPQVPAPQFPSEYGGLEAEFQERVPDWEPAAQAAQFKLRLGPEVAGAVGAAAGRLKGPLGQAFSRALQRRLVGVEVPEGLPAAMDAVVLGLLKKPEVRAELEAVAADLFGREIRAANLEQFVAQAPKISGIWAGAILADALGMVLFGRRWARVRLESLDPKDNPIHRLDGQRQEALEPPNLVRAQALAHMLELLGEGGLAGDLRLDAEGRFASSFQLFLGGLSPVWLRCEPFALAMSDLSTEVLTRRFEFLEGATLLEAVDRSAANPERALREALAVAEARGLAGLPRDQVPMLLLEANAAGPARLEALSRHLEGRIRPSVAARPRGMGQPEAFFCQEALLRGVVLGQALRIGRRVGG